MADAGWTVVQRQGWSAMATAYGWSPDRSAYATPAAAAGAAAPAAAAQAPPTPAEEVQFMVAVRTF